MTEPIRPMTALVVRLWREPGAPEGDAGWRGLVRPLDKEVNLDTITFHGLENLPSAVHRALRHLPPDRENKT